MAKITIGNIEGDVIIGDKIVINGKVYKAKTCPECFTRAKSLEQKFCENCGALLEERE
jgi:hypothetical protein